jgi:hypothetical protein
LITPARREALSALQPGQMGFALVRCSDPPSQDDETAAWALVQKALSAPEASPREKLYLVAVAALYKVAEAGSKSARDQNYRDAMAVAYARYPDDETALRRESQHTFA